MNLNFNDELYSNQIEDIMKHLNIKLNGIYSKDELPSRLKNGCYIINLDNSTGEGTHWTAFYKYNKTIYYFDSFGFPPPQNEINIFFKGHDQLKYNDIEIQDEKSILCGYFCIGFFIAIKYFHGSLPYKISQFQRLFKSNTKLNDSVLKNFILTYYNNI